MKTIRFERPGALLIDYYPRAEPPYWLIWRPNTSCIRHDRKALLKEAKWPPKTPTGDELRAWLDECEAMQQPQPPAT